MSIDAYLVMDTGGEHPAYVTEGINHTHNTTPMWNEAMKRTGLAKKYDRFYDFLEGGKRFESDPDHPGTSRPTGNTLTPPKGRDAAVVLRAMVMEMEQDPDSFTAMNPENGWGNYESAMEFWRLFLADCVAHPLATIYVSI